MKFLLLVSLTLSLWSSLGFAIGFTDTVVVDEPECEPYTKTYRKDGAGQCVKEECKVEAGEIWLNKEVEPEGRFCACAEKGGFFIPFWGDCRDQHGAPLRDENGNPIVPPVPAMD